MKKAFFRYLASALMLASAAGVAAGANVPAVVPAGAAQTQAPSFLTGTVKTIPATGRTLSAGLEQARREAKSSHYFTVSLFESRHKISRHDDSRIVEAYSVKTQGTKIRVRSKSESGREGISMSDDQDSPSPAGMLLLHDGAGAVLDASVLDPAQAYEFGDLPVFWLGTADNDQSLGIVESLYAAGRDNPLKKNLLFLAACHTGTRAPAFLKTVALGTDAAEVRETAVFWLGNGGDARSLADLKDIYRKEKSDRVKKQIVFAIQLGKSKEAVEELIRIARSEDDREIRKTAVFWLGQRASAESLKALKDIVEEDGETGIREQAVFAISQLPKDKSVPLLIDIAKTNKSVSVRKKAIFWLGQSGDDAALKFFEDILLKK